MSEEDDDICRNYHGGNSESEDANEVVAPHKSIQRGNIFRVIRQHMPEGIHCEKIEGLLHMKHQSASARIAELRAAGVISIVGYTTTTSGARARVYAVASEENSLQ